MCVYACVGVCIRLERVCERACLELYYVFVVVVDVVSSVYRIEYPYGQDTVFIFCL